MTEKESRIELADFLRSRRERLTPAEVGLPTIGRRRTPGLRREEVAQLARVGVTWYTWLEQGRTINASAAVIEAIAGALRLDQGEAAHLYTLAGVVPNQPIVETSIDPLTQRVLQSVSPWPALVVNARTDVLAWNRTAELLLGSLASLPCHRRNNLWLIHTEPRWQRLIVDADAIADHLVALFRSALADHLTDPSWQALTAELADVSSAFARRWSHHRVAEPSSQAKFFNHPGSGMLRFYTTTQWLQPRIGPRMIVYCPVDEETEEAVGVMFDSDAVPSDEWSDLARYGRGAGAVSADLGLKRVATG